MTVRAWWLGEGTLGHRDGRVVRIGGTHKVTGQIELCKHGLHASVSPLDAVRYGNGHFYRVECGGTIIHSDDKLVASERTYLWRVKDTAAVLRHFARLCALDVTHLWDVPDVVMRYLRTGDAALQEARAATWAVRAARAAAAGDAALAARAARAATWAARAAAEAAPETQETQSRRLHRMLMRAERVTV
jgi:hypothetical protein